MGKVMELLRPGSRVALVARLCFATAIVVAASDLARAQDVVASGYGSNSFEQYGISVAYGPDLNGDGFGEVAIGAFGNLGTKGSVFVVSGRDFSQIVELDGQNAGDQFGQSVCWCGDLDGDGLADLAAGAPTASAPGEVRIFSSANWAVIRKIDVNGSGRLGIALADAGDMNSDGFDDLLAGAPWAAATSTGSVYLLSGADGSVLRSWSGKKGDEFGIAVAAIGDANGDGITDVAIGSPGADQGPGDDNSGAVDLYSGADGSLLWRRYGTYWYDYGGYGSRIYYGDYFGTHVDRAGDVNGDGHADVLASAGNKVTLHLLSGVDGSDVRTISTHGYAPRCAPIGDLQGDGLPEIAACMPGWIGIYSSRDGKSIWQSDDFSSQRFFTSLAGTGDVDGDGLPDFLVGDPNDGTNGTAAGRVDLRTASALWLDVEPSHHPQIWMTLDLRANEGPTGNLAGLALTGVNGTPLFQFLTFATFDATGSALLAHVHVPTGLTGTVLELRAFAIGASGHVVASTVEKLTLP
jgi:WD40 repeat protein